MPYRVLKISYLVQNIKLFLHCCIQIAFFHNGYIQILGYLAKEALQMVHPIRNGLVCFENQAVLLCIIQALQYIIKVINLNIHQGSSGICMNVFENFQGRIVLNVQCQHATRVFLGGNRPMDNLIVNVLMDKNSFAIAAPQRLQIQLWPEICHGNIVGRLYVDMLLQLLVEPLDTALFIHQNNHLGQFFQSVIGGGVYIANNCMTVVFKLLAAAKTALSAKKQQTEPYKPSS